MESLKNVLANMLRDTLFMTHARMDSWCICNVIMIPSPTASPTITHLPIIYLHQCCMGHFGPSTAHHPARGALKY